MVEVLENVNWLPLKHWSESLTEKPAVGYGLTLTFTLADVKEGQPFCVITAVYAPAEVTGNVADVFPKTEPFKLHSTLPPVGRVIERVVDWPVHRATVPEGLITGVVGMALTVTVIRLEVSGPTTV